MKKVRLSAQREVRIMTRLFIHKEYASLQDKMIVKNEQGQEVYLIVGKWGRLGDKLTIYTLDGRRLVEAKQVVLSLFPKFRLYQDGKKIGSLKKRPGLKGIKKPFFTVTRLNWTITGDYDKQIFTVRRFGRRILTIQKTMSYSGEQYMLTFQNERLAPVACVVAPLLDHYDKNNDPLLQEIKQQRYSLGFLRPVFIKLRKIIFSR